MGAMNFPDAAKKKKYAENIQSTYELEQPVSFISVPGPQGERGPKGDTGDIGPQGIPGAQGDPGKPGKNGKDGIDGKPGISSLSPSGQRTGWGLYTNLKQKSIKLGAKQGNDGWVRFNLDCAGDNNEEYLPENNVSLYNKETQKINLRGLKIGSIITIRYNIVLTTFFNNTEVWLRTYVPDFDRYPTTLVGFLKYQYEYEFSLEHTFFLENTKMQNSGAFPEILTDNEAMMSIKSMYIYVR